MAGRATVLCVHGAPLPGRGPGYPGAFRLLGGSQVREHAQEHSLYVRVEPARVTVLTTVNLHLPPALPSARRRTVVGDGSAFVRTAGASVKVVASDLNKAPGPRGGGWLSKALGPTGPLAGF